MDKSNGYEGIAPFFIKTRGQALNGIGTASVLNWARTLPMKATVLDLGCGTGIPISKILMDEGMRVYGIDASSTMIKAFQENFPTTAVACDSIEDSCFFNGTFDAINCLGSIFSFITNRTSKVNPEGCSRLAYRWEIIVYRSPHAG